MRSLTAHSARTLLRCVPTVLTMAAVAVGLSPARAQEQRDKDKDKDRRPVLSLRATPAVSLSPARIFLVAELKGGSDDYEEFYCAGVEWDWGDGTKSESSYDCEPYESGKSQIKRRFAVEHVFNQAGSFRVQFRLKRHSKVIASASTAVQVRAGLREF